MKVKMHQVTLEGERDSVLVFLPDGRRVVVSADPWHEDGVRLELRDLSGMLDHVAQVGFKYPKGPR